MPIFSHPAATPDYWTINPIQAMNPLCPLSVSILHSLQPSAPSENQHHSHPISSKQNSRRLIGPTVNNKPNIRHVSETDLLSAIWRCQSSEYLHDVSIPENIFHPRVILGVFPPVRLQYMDAVLIHWVQQHDLRVHVTEPGLLRQLYNAAITNTLRVIHYCINAKN